MTGARPELHEYPDALARNVRGRGAGINPANRFETTRLHVLGEALDAEDAEAPRGVQVPTAPLADRTRSVINRVDSPDLDLRWTLNPYRGCEHGCVYCYARPTHELLGFSCGLDFETRIMVKHDAPELLRRELAAPRWHGEPINLAGVTDVYQPLEAKLEVTRACLEVMVDCGQPVCIVTKNRLVTRDIDLLARLAARGAARVALSVTTLDARLSRSMEPRASCPRDRLAALRELADAGVPCMVMVAPVIPGLTDHELPAILEAAAAHGAVSAAWMMLRLPRQVKDVFIDWLRRERPQRAPRVEAALRDVRAGGLTDSAFGRRLRGTGARAEHIAAAFQTFRRRCGLDRPLPPLSSASFRRPAGDGQLTLFQER